MGRSQKKYNYIYKTTNLINGKYYIGMHSTDNLKDGYIGSGKRLWYSIKKYGKENFLIEILEFYDNRELLKNREKELVNENLINDHLCMNLKKGGEGGGKLWSKEHAQKFHSAGGRAVRLMFGKIHREKMKTDVEYRNRVIEKLKGNKSFFGKNHKEETKKKIGLINSKKQKGKNNSQFGTIWISNGIENKKIKKDEEIPKGWEKGRYYKKN